MCSAVKLFYETVPAAFAFFAAPALPRAFLRAAPCGGESAAWMCVHVASMCVMREPTRLRRCSVGMPALQRHAKQKEHDRSTKHKYKHGASLINKEQHAN